MALAVQYVESIRMPQQSQRTPVGTHFYPRKHNRKNWAVTLASRQLVVKSARGHIGFTKTRGQIRAREECTSDTGHRTSGPRFEHRVAQNAANTKEGNPKQQLKGTSKSGLVRSQSYLVQRK
jgi:hypothetical protein